MSAIRVTVEGYLSADPELRYTSGGKAVCDVSVPHTPRRRNEAGEWEDAGPTVWVKASLWDAAAEAAAALVKGDRVMLTATAAAVETYERRDGQVGASLVLRGALLSKVIDGRGAGGQKAPAGTGDKQDAGWSPAGGDSWAPAKAATPTHNDDIPF